MQTVLVMGLVGYVACYVFENRSVTEQWVVSIAMLLLVFPVTRLPLKVIDAGDRIVIRQLVGKKVFRKEDYRVEEYHPDGTTPFTLRLFGCNVWLYWGYFRNKRIGNYFGQHVGNRDLLLLTGKKDGRKYLIDMPTEGR